MTVQIVLNDVTLGSAVPGFAVRRIERGMLATVRDERVSLAGRAGSWYFEEEPGNRVIVIEGMLRADGTAARRAAMNALAEWATTNGPAELVFSDESDRFYNVTLDRQPDVSEALRYGEVELEFIADPYPYANTPSTEAIAASGSPDSGTFNATLEQPAEPVIEITPTNGTLTSFTLTVNGYEIAWQDGGGPLTIADDQTITISSISDTVTLGLNNDLELTGAFDPDDVVMANVAITGFPDLINGSNSWTLTWTGTATTVDIDFTWRERFI